MAEYIKKEEIEQKIQDGLNNLVLGHDAIEVLGMIYEMPTADVALVRHAKVIDKIYDDHETIKQPWDYRYYCSACKIPMRDSWNKYCPNCGAKMDLEG